MNYQNIKKYELLPEFLHELFKIEQDDKKLGTVSKIRILKVNLQELAKELKNYWTYFYENQYDYSSLQYEYIEKFQPWKEKFNAFNAVKDNQEFLKFLERHFSTWMKLSFKSKDITKKEIADMVTHQRPKFFLSAPISMGSYKSLLIFNQNSFQLTAHLKLKEFKTNTYSLVIVFSFWFDNMHDSWEANLKFINESYKNFMIAYNITKKLKSIKYEESTLKVEQPKTGNKFIISPYTITEKHPHPSNNLILETLSDDPIRLFKNFVSHLYIIDEEIQKYKDQNEFSPYSYYENLTLELKQFLLKGKELFLKAEDLLEKSTFNKKKSGITVEKSSEELKISFEQIIGFFKDALEKDKSDDTKSPEEKGFRTKNQIFDKYKDNIDCSKPTFYYYFENLKLESFLELRNKSGKGGGKEFKYKEFMIDSDQILDTSIEAEKLPAKEDLSTERIEIQEALTYYNNHDFELSINIFTRILKSNKLESDPTIYIACLYYLGRSYFKKGDYKKAIESFNKAYMKNQSKYNVKYALAESYLYYQDYPNALKLVNEIIREVRNIIKTSEINLNLDYIFIRPIDADSLDIIHPQITEKDLLSNYLILLNKSPIPVHHFRVQSVNRQSEMFKVVNKNINSIQIIYKKYTGSLFLKLEILRRCFFRQVFEKNEEQISKIVGEFLLYCRELNKDLENTLSTEDYLGYISYFKGILKIFGFPIIENQISDEYPDLEHQTNFPKTPYLTKFKEFYSFLDFVNEILNKNFDEYVRTLYLVHLSKLSLMEGFSNPIFKAEFYFIEAYINLNYLIDERIKSEEDSNTKFDTSTINNREDIFKLYDNYHSMWPRFKHPSFYLLMAEKAYSYSKKHKFNYLAKSAKVILDTTQNKVEIIENIRLERRKKIINRKLEILNISFKDITEEITLSFQKKPREGFSHFVRIRIKREIEKRLREKTGNLTFNIRLFNPELNKDVMEALRKETIYRESVEGRTRSFFIIKMELEESKVDRSIIIKMTHNRDLKQEGNFAETLDGINRLIYNTIDLNLNSFTIKLDPEKREKYHNYFEKDFKTEYKNGYFDFKILEQWENNEIRVQIKKL